MSPVISRTGSRATRRGGFTLVELLVVIGIIALLISILLPSLNAAREQAQVIKCLSNLRQIGVAAAAYTAQNKNTLLPADVRRLNPNSPTLAVNGQNYQDVEETWATILVADGYLSVPESADKVTPPQTDNVYRCPSGINEMSSITSLTSGASTVPSSRLDSRGAMGILHTSTRLKPNMNIFTWYGINATNSTGYETPFWRCNIDVGAGNKVTKFRKTNEIRAASEMVFLFDGMYGHNLISGNANRINARHNNKKVTNLAFVDGHAESMRTADLPGGAPNASVPTSVFGGNPYNPAALAAHPFPKWRLEQK